MSTMSSLTPPVVFPASTTSLSHSLVLHTFWASRSGMNDSFVTGSILIGILRFLGVIYTESNKSSGCFSAMASNFKAASLGVRRPASQA
jgi:hypothetical protein